MTLDPIDIHVLAKDAADADKARRLAIESMSAQEQGVFAGLPKTRQDALLAMSPVDRSKSLLLPDPGAVGGPMDPFAKGPPPKVVPGPQAVEPDETPKPEEKPEEEK